ncbi:STAS domain-containing protein [Pseudomonas sp. CAU 1711]|uniref:STAS domain-containing protein n=1 Tax=Pseudomonas sp. CAU 1711 TaxID=3140356 RepID=UPI0032618DA8
MNDGAIRLGESGELLLSGVLDYRSGPRLREAGRKLIAANGASLVLDCSAVEKSSSVGLSLLLAFARDAKAAGKHLEVRGLPQDMREIAKVSGLQELFGAQS